jgi:hypothetical protein
MKKLYGGWDWSERPLNQNIYNVLVWAEKQNIREGDVIGIFCGSSDWNYLAEEKISGIVNLVREMKATPVVVSCHTNCNREDKLRICLKLGICFAVATPGDDLFEIESGQQLSLLEPLN